MSRNDVVMTPLRVKQAIDSRFVKPSEDELNVFINGAWMEFVKVDDEPDLPPAVNCAELSTMYKGDTTLIETPVINATGCTSLQEVFRGCTNLVTVEYIHTPNVSNMINTFRDCSSLMSVPKLDMRNVSDASTMFRGCSSLISVPALDTSNTKYMSQMFYECSSLTSIPPLDVSKTTNSNNMFRGCSSLTSVTFTGDVVLPYGAYMFYDTPIASGNGYIFVPDDMVDEYKSASGWSIHASIIKGISEKEGLQSTIMGFNLMIEENPTMFKLTDEELEELEK